MGEGRMVVVDRLVDVALEMAVAAQHTVALIGKDHVAAFRRLADEVAPLSFGKWRGQPEAISVAAQVIAPARDAASIYATQVLGSQYDDLFITARRVALTVTGVHDAVNGYATHPSFPKGFAMDLTRLIAVPLSPLSVAATARGRVLGETGDAPLEPPDFLDMGTTSTLEGLQFAWTMTELWTVPAVADARREILTALGRPGE